VLIWRFRRQRGSGEFPETAERRAQLVAAGGLLAIAVTLLVTAIQHLATQAHPDSPSIALALAAANLLVLPVLAVWKYRAAEAVRSLALRTDAHITMVGTSTSALTLLGLGLERGLGWWWADAAAAIAIGAVAAQQGGRSISAVGESSDEP
jgi:divalent metal cation (Fe/Co/Zn/Cd) transporter